MSDQYLYAWTFHVRVWRHMTQSAKGIGCYTREQIAQFKQSQAECQIDQATITPDDVKFVEICKIDLIPKDNLPKILGMFGDNIIDRFDIE